ncbi:hypothetical protein [Streptomyces sp. ME19-01-6]|uniref:hypothetical protein n=1 Tax=Streptomyces sp. ME19-01-6 TaxID=3028686 RepID=UPI0029A5970F|nr:hypothetical protein [Streptomyces sp. ME19-01-6]MDX3230600.1 hypothetical protein [Streptomyces sp. ME19-01-6]
MAATIPTPADLDRAAARMYKARPLTAADRRAFDQIAAGYERTAPAVPAARNLVTKTVDELVAEALGGINPHGTRPPVDVRLPGRLAAVMPDWAHRGRRRDITHPPSTQLYVAAAILREWGWQAKPHKLRNRRGQRCICGALVTTVALGIGTMSGAETAAWHVLCELRGRGWNRGLIGDWNQQQGTAETAIDVTLSAYQRAVAAGQ